MYQGPTRQGVDPVALVTLIGVIALLMITFTNMRDVERLDRSLGDRIAKLEGQLANAPRAAAGAPAQGEDPNRVYTVRVPADAPIRGRASAPVTIALFSDFQCPFCGRVEPTLKQVQEVYKDQVRIVWKHMPLTSIHPRAMGAAQASEAALSQGKFWEFHDKLFVDQKKLEVSDFKQFAQELGLNMDRFEKDMVDVEKKKRIEADMDEAKSLGVTGTPALFVNGRKLVGAKPFDDIARVIDAELSAKNLPIPPKPAS